MSSFKRLNKADVTTVNYHANKKWNFNYGANAYLTGSITYYAGLNDPFSIDGPVTNGGTIYSQYQSLIYSTVNHLFYQDYTASLDTGSLMFNINTYESASSQRPTSSYFNYNTNPLLVKNFTSSNSGIGLINISPELYGSKILPTSFAMTSSAYNIKDDGNGNLYHNSTHVGNIFYAHGMIILTNQSSTYQQNLFINPYNISFQNEHIIYENEVRCIVRESDFNLTYNPTIVSGSYESGSLYNFATASFFQPYATSIGLYNDNNDLLMVAKLAKPIVLSADTDTTFIVRYDT